MPDGLKIPTNIELNKQQMEQQFNQMGNSLANSIEKALDTSKLARDMGNNFNKISTRDLDRGMKNTVENIRKGVKESEKYSQSINELTSDVERLKRVARSGDFFEKTSKGETLNSVNMKYWDDALQMSQEYQRNLYDISKIQDRIRYNEKILAEGTKTRAETADERVARGARRELGYGESARAITEKLSPQEIAQITNQNAHLNQEMTKLYENLSNLENRGDAFPKLTQSIELTVVALNKISERVFTSIGQFEKLSQTATQSMNGITTSEQGAQTALNNLSGINFAQPIQTQTASVEQSMQTVTQSVTDGVQQVQQATSQTLVTQVIDTSAIQNQIQFLSGQLTGLSATIQTQMAEVTNSVNSGFQTVGETATSRISEINANLQTLGTGMTTALEQMTAQSSASFQALGDRIETAMQRMSNRIVESLRHVTVASNRASTSVSQVGRSARTSGALAVAGFTTFGKMLKATEKSAVKLSNTLKHNIVSGLSGIKKSVENVFSSRSLKRGLTTLLKYGFGVRSLYFAFRKLRNMIKEGLENLVQFDSANNRTNQAITELRTSLLYLKNAWASALAPVINVVEPILTSLMNKLAETANAIARFVGALTGQEIVLNAVRVSAGDYADSLDKSSKSAGSASNATKKLTDRLASFDDLNVLGKDKDNDGGGGGSGLEDYVPDPNEMFKYVEAQSSFADMLKEAWTKGDFTGVGEALKDKIIEVLKGIQWEDIQSTVSQGATFAGQFIKGLFGDPELFKEVGKTVGEGINTVTYAVKSFLDETRGVDFGGNLAQGLNEFLNTTDFKQAGANISDAFTQITTNINSFLDTISTDEISTAISDFISTLDIPKMLADAGKTAIKFTAKAIEITDETIKKLGEDLGEKLHIYVSSKNITTLLDEEGNEVEIELVPTYDESEHPIKALFDRGLTDIGKFFIEDLVGANTIEDINLLADGFDNLISKLEKFQSIFEILAGLVTGNLPTMIDGFLKLFAQTSLWETLSNAFNKFKEDFSVGCEVIGLGFVGLVDGIESGCENIANFFTTLGENTKTGWETIKTTVTTKAQELKDKAEQKVTDLKEKFAETWQNIRTTAFEKFTLMRVGIVEAFNALKEAVKTPINGFLGVIESMVNKVIGGVNKVIDAINALPDIKFTNPFTGTEYALGVTVPRLSTITIPRLAQGAVIPPNKEFLAMLGDQSSGTNIEAPLDTIKQAVAEELSAQIEVLTNGFQSVVSAINNKELAIGDKQIGMANARYTSRQNLIRGTNF